MLVYAIGMKQKYTKSTMWANFSKNIGMSDVVRIRETHTHRTHNVEFTSMEKLLPAKIRASRQNGVYEF